MTLKEYAQKYGVPYHIVYESSYKVQPISTWIRDRDYPENKLTEAILEIAEQRINKHKRLMAQQIAIKNRIKGVKA